MLYDEHSQRLGNVGNKWNFQQIKALGELQTNRYQDLFANWQYTLLALAFLAVTIIFNTYLAKVLPALETLSLVGHLAGFVVVLIPLWVMCPKNSASEVFTTFVNGGGWSDVGTACLVSQTAVLYCNLGLYSFTTSLTALILTKPRL